MRYKVGDVVKLRDDLEDGNRYGTTRYAREMDFIKGKPMELTEKSKIFEDCYITKDENDVEWYISDEMIEGLWEECKGITYEPYKEKTNKYKFIDILNKIANGELKEGTKFVYRGNMYIWEDNMILNTSNLEPFDIADRSDLNMELELIEPEEPTECEHEWVNYGRYNPNTGETKDFRKCAKCGLEEDIEPTDNTKIEELIDWYQLIDGTTDEETIHIVWNKLNEVIRKINKEE